MQFAPELVIEPVTRRLIEAFIHSPSHGIMLEGQDGVGLLSLAKEIGSHIYTDGVQELLSPEDGKEITIQQVRDLYVTTKSIHEEGLVVIVDDCDQMSVPAQNALLKLLEEPPQHTLFVLTSHNPGNLLPTITSRVSHIEVKRISDHDSQTFIASLVADKNKQAQVAFLAQGRPAAIVRLARDTDIFESQAAVIRDAREFFQASSYRRLILINAYSGRDAALELLNALSGLLMFTQRKGENVPATQYDAVVSATDNIHDNAHVKLQLMKLAITL